MPTTAPTVIVIPPPDMVEQEPSPWPPEPTDGTSQVEGLYGIIMRYAVNFATVVLLVGLTALVSRMIIALILPSSALNTVFFSKALPFGLGVAVGVASLVWLFAARGIFVTANTGVVVQSLFGSSITSFLQGFYLLYFWEDVYKEPIDLEKDVIISEGAGETFLTANDVPLEVKFYIARRPHPFYLVNYVSNKPESSDPLFKARIKKFLSEVFRSADDSVVLNAIGQIKPAFVKLFGGADKTDNLERAFGVWTSNPELYNIKRTSKGEETRMKVVEAQAFTDAIREYMKMQREQFGTEITFEQARRDILLMSGEVSEHIINIAGIGTLADLPRGMRDFAISVNPLGVGGAHGQSKGKGPNKNKGGKP